MNAQPCAVNTRHGVLQTEAASRARIPTFELWACTIAGRSRRISRISSTSPTRSRSPGARLTLRSGTHRAPASSAAARGGPSPWAATATSKCSASAGRSCATHVCAPPTSASVIATSSFGLPAAWRRCRRSASTFSPPVSSRSTGYRAPKPESSLEKVFAQTARSIARLRCRRYQRSYESFVSVLAASAA